jgi:hypothetical protein
MMDGRAACPSCGNAARKPIPCVACTRMTKRPKRSAEAGGLICERCSTRHTHATCRTCRRHRRVARRDEDGRPLCKACGADAPVTHACPDCGLQAPGSGAAACRRCSLARRVARTVALEAALLKQAWTRDLFAEFCKSDRLRRERGDMTRHIAAYARFFAVLDESCEDVGEVTQARLVDLYGAEGLRRGFQAVAFLAGRLKLAWDADVIVAVTERRRVEATIAAAVKEPWIRDLESYRRHLTIGRKLALNTKRMYVVAAAALLAASGVRQVSELTQRHLARHLRRSRGRRNNLVSFLSWVTSISGQRFDPGRSRRTPPRKREKATLRKAAILLDRLAAAEIAREHRALLAAATSVLQGLPLSEVLAFRKGDPLGDGRTILVARSGPVETSGLLAAGFRKLMAGPGALAFPGRNGLQPISYAAVRHHLRLVPACVP